MEINFAPWMCRTELLLGTEKLAILNRSHVLVAGLGGVGAYAAEQICRAGVGEMTIVDGDIVTETNKNRQLLALDSTLGQSKTEVIKQRLLDINPQLKLKTIDIYLKNEKIDDLLSQNYNYVVDAIDTLSPKFFFIMKCLEKNLPLVSSMGAGGKLDPMQIKVSDIYESHGCRLALHIRKRLRKRNILSGFKVVFSPEAVDKESLELITDVEHKRSNIGTIAYMPALFGCLCASVVIRDLISGK